MKHKNGKWNKALIIGLLLYGIMFLDIIINTVIAHVSNDGVPRITNALMVGPIVLILYLLVVRLFWVRCL